MIGSATYELSREDIDTLDTTVTTGIVTGLGILVAGAKYADHLSYTDEDGNELLKLTHMSDARDGYLVEANLPAPPALERTWYRRETTNEATFQVRVLDPMEKGRAPAERLLIPSENFLRMARVFGPADVRGKMEWHEPKKVQLAPDIIVRGLSFAITHLAIYGSRDALTGRLGQ